LAMRALSDGERTCRILQKVNRDDNLWRFVFIPTP
jgi:hypothetical protein